MGLEHEMELGHSTQPRTKEVNIVFWSLLGSLFTKVRDSFFFFFWRNRTKYFANVTALE